MPAAGSLPRPIQENENRQGDDEHLHGRVSVSGRSAGARGRGRAARARVHQLQRRHVVQAGLLQSNANLDRD